MVESPSGVIIRPPSDPNAIPAPLESSDSVGMAPTIKGPSLAAYGSNPSPGVLAPGLPPNAVPLGAAPPLPVGPGASATTVRPPKTKGRSGLWIGVVFVLLALAAAAYYVVKVRGIAL